MNVVWPVWKRGLLVFVEGLHSLLSLWQHFSLPCRPSTIPCAMLARAKRELLGVERFQKFLTPRKPVDTGVCTVFLPVHHFALLSFLSPGFAPRVVQAAVLLERFCCSAKWSPAHSCIDHKGRASNMASLLRVHFIDWHKNMEGSECWYFAKYKDVVCNVTH